MRNTKLMATLFFAAIVGLFLAPSQAQADHLVYDIAQDDHTFSFDNDPLLENGFPAYGNEFIVQAYLYPGYTLSGDDGVNPDGSPQWPEKVIGSWTCRGWFVGQGFATVTGPLALTQQFFDLGEDPGDDTITTDGYEYMDETTVDRAITGGTGEFEGARGRERQKNIGFNATGGMNIRAWLKIW